MNEIIEVTISSDGATVQTLVKNTREDLLHDFQYFLIEAKKHDPSVLDSKFLHPRFLRAALLTLFAYAESVVNGWLYSLLEARHEGSRFTELQWKCLDKKIEMLTDFSSTAVAKPCINDAKQLRNLFVHFTPKRENDAFDNLSLDVVEDASTDLFRWMTEMESSLNVVRHVNSEELARAFDEIGTPINQASSDPRK